MWRAEREEDEAFRRHLKQLKDPKLALDPLGNVITLAVPLETDHKVTALAIILCPLKIGYSPLYLLPSRGLTGGNVYADTHDYGINGQIKPVCSS